jgi:hypothetical protein
MILTDHIAQAGVVSVFAYIFRFAYPSTVARLRNSFRNPVIGVTLGLKYPKVRCSDDVSLLATAQNVRRIRRTLIYRIYRSATEALARDPE